MYLELEKLINKGVQIIDVETLYQKYKNDVELMKKGI